MYKKIKRKILKKLIGIYGDKILDKKNVTGIGVGYKIKNGKATNKLCITVGVKEKIDVDQLADEDLIPEKLVGLFQTDVLPTGELKMLSAWREKCRPVRVGSSMCNENLTACSTGLPVYSKEKNFVMNNSHCSHPDFGNVGDKILQPGPADGGTAEDHFATATKYFYDRDPSDDDNIDVALDELVVDMVHKDVSGREYEPETRRLNERDILKDIEGGSRNWDSKDEKRTGIIIAVDFVARVKSDRGLLQFKDCVLAVNGSKEDKDIPIVEGGCSSSIRFVDNKPLLQTFAGSTIAAVFNQTKKSLDFFEDKFNLDLQLTPPERKEEVEGYIAINPKWQGENKIKTPLGQVLRNSPGVGNNRIGKLPEGTEFEEVDQKHEYASGYRWMKVKAEI